MKDILKWVVIVGLFLVPFLPVYVVNDLFFPFITGKNFAFRIIIEIVFASWILLALYDAQYRPRFSWILAGFASFLVIMAFANALGQYPAQSFWSNFERMEGMSPSYTYLCSWWLPEVYSLQTSSGHLFSICLLR